MNSRIRIDENGFVNPVIVKYPTLTLMDVSTYDFLEMYHNLLIISQNKIMPLLEYKSDTTNIKTLDDMSSSVSKSYNLLQFKFMSKKKSIL